MTEGGGGLGAELRRRREEAGLTLRALAREISYDKGHLSRVERGMSPPGRRLVELYDMATGADGELTAALLPGADRPASPRSGTGAGPGTGRPARGRRWSPDERESAVAAAAFQASLAQLRAIGRELPPGAVLPALEGQFRALSTLTSGGPRPDRRLLRQAARTAEYAGWMAQEAGDEVEARRWTGTAAELAARAAHRDLRAYTWVRRAELELYAGRPDLVLELAHRAGADGHVHPRVRALAAHRAGQGYALRGDQVSCLRELGRAEELWAGAAEVAGESLDFGPESLGNPGPFVAGWCWVDLGRPGRAAEELSVAVGRTRSTQSRRGRGLFGTRLARAYVESGELQQGVEVGRRALRAVTTTRSATACGELRTLVGRIETAPWHRPAADFAARARELLAEVDADTGRT